MERKLISLGILVSYDYEYLKKSLPLVYEYSDFINLAIDKNKKTWAGDYFVIEDSFYKWLKDIDVDNKINIVEYEIEDSFKDPMEIETYLRNILGKINPEATWFIQIDTDEYFLDFPDFINQLKKINSSNNISIIANFITMFKSDEKGVYMIENFEDFYLATNNPVYHKARVNYNNKTVKLNVCVLHQSWAREENEILTKINNWGHKLDFDTLQYFNFWKSVQEFNYKYIRNFHPLYDKLWESLIYVKAINYQELANFYIKLIEKKKREEETSQNQNNTIKYKIKRIILLLLPPIFSRILKNK